MAVGLRCVRMDLGEPDASGRPRPVPRPGSEFDIEATTIIAAISQEPKLDGLDLAPQRRAWIPGDGRASSAAWMACSPAATTSSWGWSPLPSRRAVSRPRPSTPGSRARPLERPAPGPCVTPDRVKLDWYKPAERHEREHVPVAERAADTEIQTGTQRRPKRSTKPSGACPAACAWIAKPAGCTAPTTVS